MSIKAIKAVLACAKYGHETTPELDALAAISNAALEKAAQVLAESRFSATVAEERNAEIDWAAMETLMEAIANEGEE